MAAIDHEFVDRMEDVLRLYARPHDQTAPVICLDERPVVLHDEERAGKPIAPGRPARTDYEYVRKKERRTCSASSSRGPVAA